MTIREALSFARDSLSKSRLSEPQADALVLASAVLGVDKSFLFGHPGRALSREQWVRFQDFVQQRSRRYPVQYLTQNQEFFGRNFWVCEGVLIPRPETELLIETALEKFGVGSTRPLRVLDLGTGSGNIAVTLAQERPSWRITATDVSATALAVARKNAGANACSDRICFRKGSLFEAVPGERFHLILSNPPYVAGGDRTELDPSVRDFEPAGALFGGADGMSFYRSILAAGSRHLCPGGSLLLELGFGQSGQVVCLAELEGWAVCSLRRDLSGIDRCLLLSRRGEFS